MVEYFQTPPWMSGMLGAAISRRGENTRTIIWYGHFSWFTDLMSRLIKTGFAKSLMDLNFTVFHFIQKLSRR